MTEVFVNCKPLGKARPRFMTMGGKVHTYTPKATKDMEKLIADVYQASGGKHYGEDMLHISIIAKFNPPKSTSKKKIIELLKSLYYDKKPDVDNIAKLVLDALNGIAYTDDKQVVALHCEKIYTNGEQGINITIEEKL